MAAIDEAYVDPSSGAKRRRRKFCAVVAITQHGTAIARQILEALPDVDVYYPAKFGRGDEDQLGIHLFPGSVLTEAPKLWHAYDGIVGIFSLGAMVRIIAPLLEDKKTDPGIVVIDDRAQHVISVLSGHLGGANQLTRQIATVLGADPVLTTASDVQGTLAVDLLGREFGWEIANFARVTEVSAAVVNGERVHIVQEAGERTWWPADRPYPDNLKVFPDTASALVDSFQAALVITPRLLTPSEHERLLSKGVLYRPKVLVVGIGCNRGTAAEEIEEAINRMLENHQLSIRSIRNVATIELKKDEPGLLDVCHRHGWPLHTYTAEELNRIASPHPSDVVFRYTGAYGVAEPAARLSSGAQTWLVEKEKWGNVTLSLCFVAGLGLPNEKGDRA